MSAHESTASSTASSTLRSEDADEALAKRKPGTLSEVSALLNYADGIFGSILNLRIIATTNLEWEELDEAARRESRLCRRLQVGKLDQEQAQAIYKR